MSNEQNPGVEKVSDKLRQLLQAAIKSAKSTLQGGQGILPCSIARGPDGKIRLAIAAVGGKDGSNQLVLGLRNQAASGEITAAALYRDMRVRTAGKSQDEDAIHVFSRIQLDKPGTPSRFTARTQKANMLTTEWLLSRERLQYSWAHRRKPLAKGDGGNFGSRAG